MNCGVGHRHSSDPALLWLWCKLAVVVAPIRPLAWEPPYAAGVDLEKAKRKTNKKKEQQQQKRKIDSANKKQKGEKGKYLIKNVA